MKPVHETHKDTLSKEDFANLLMNRLRAAGETETVEYDPESFMLVKPPMHSHMLGDIYQHYKQASGAEREKLIGTFLASWRVVCGQDLPDFDDIKAELLPFVRPRTLLTIDYPHLFDALPGVFRIPHNVIADHLVILAQLNRSGHQMPVSGALLKYWKLSYSEVMQIAKDNLRKRPYDFVKKGGVYAFVSHEGDEPTRMLLSESIRDLDVAGELIVTVPNRHALFVCGSEDPTSLEFMVHATQINMPPSSRITGMAFRLVDDKWEVWLPPESHCTHAAFRELQLKSIGYIYAQQAEVLIPQSPDAFVATYMVRTVKKTGRQISCCTWTDGVPALLPEAEEICFVQGLDPNYFISGIADWETVQKVAGHLMEPQGLYPERWLVREFPSQSLCEQMLSPPESAEC
jgi:hypothetical protein